MNSCRKAHPQFVEEYLDDLYSALEDLQAEESSYRFGRGCKRGTEEYFRYDSLMDAIDCAEEAIDRFEDTFA